jgi:uncharacterized protein
MKTRRLCPICKRPIAESVAETRYRPFCSRRCADLDLGHWLKGSYAIPAAQEDDAKPAGEGETGEDAAESRRRK